MATTKQLWQQNNNRLYWEKREQKQRELYMMEEAQQQRELEKIYAEMYRHAEDEINRFYGKYADAEGIDITEAKKRVTQADIEAYEALAKEYVKNKDFSDRANAEMRLYNATMKINRLEMLKARIGVYLVAGINDIDDYYEKVITDRTRQEIERQAGILGETVSVADTVKRAENIVNASFFNATYSERIWSHQDRLKSMINIELQKGLIAGIGSRQMATNIRKEYDVSLADAHRLMVTELRRVQTDVAMDSYKASGVEKYVYMAVNPRACPICREIDGNVYNVADAEPAKNAPPMHPRCHCTTAPYVDEYEYNMWLEWLNKGGTTSDWNTMTDAERRNWFNNPMPITQTAPQPQEEPQTPSDDQEVQDEAIEWYTSGDGMWINQYLRGNMKTQLSDNEKVLYEALLKATDKPIPKSLKTLWRSVDASVIFGDMTSTQREQLREALIYGDKNTMQNRISTVVGKELTEDGFMSTTKSKQIAEEFEYFTGAETPMVLEFDTTKAVVKGKDLKDFEIEEDPQEEVLLHPKAKYRITGIGTGEYAEGGRYIKATAEFINS